AARSEPASVVDCPFCLGTSQREGAHAAQPALICSECQVRSLVDTIPKPSLSESSGDEHRRAVAPPLSIERSLGSSPGPTMCRKVSIDVERCPRLRLTRRSASIPEAQ